MKIKTVGWLIGAAWAGLAGVFAAPLLLALARAEPWQPFAIAAALAAAGGGLLLGLLRGAERSLDQRSAFLAVTAILLSVCALGAVPFATWPEPRLSLVDALFEATSGFTTTGATVLAGLDDLPRSLLLWRSIMQWLGGMGMVIFGIALLPLLGVGGMQIYRGEAPGPSKDQMVPRIAETARLLGLLYLGITVVAGALFRVTGMNLFDAICHAMTSIATGGFSTHDASLGHFDSGAIQVVAIAAMLAGGTSFAILRRALAGGVVWSEHPELRAYLGFFLLATALIALDLALNRDGSFASFASVLEHAAFQSASILSTTGYATRDWGEWPGLSQVTLFSLFFVGAMAGSSGGGIKVVRIVLLARLAFAQFYRLLHPHAFSVVRIGSRTVDDAIVVSSLGFIGLWFLLLALGTAVISWHGSEIFSSVSAAAATLGNVGPGFGQVAPGHTFASFETGPKLMMIALMVLGRLEIYTVLIVLTPAFWRR